MVYSAVSAPPTSPACVLPSSQKPGLSSGLPVLIFVMVRTQMSRCFIVLLPADSIDASCGYCFTRYCTYAVSSAYGW